MRRAFPFHDTTCDIPKCIYFGEWTQSVYTVVVRITFVTIPGIWYCYRMVLTHWGRRTHICLSKLTIIGSDNGLSPGRHQAIIWTNAWIILIRALGTNFSEILGEIHAFLIQENAFENVVCKIATMLSRPQCVKEVSAIHKDMVLVDFIDWYPIGYVMSLWRRVTGTIIMGTYC